MNVTPGKTSINSGPAVPAPKFRWGTRVAVPVGILVAFGALFAGAVADSLTPAVTIEAVPVVERPAVNRVVEASTTGKSEVLVQAAGWVEPAPYAVYATTLAEGSVREVLFLEGDAIEKGDVLVRLVDEDAALALRRAKAEAVAAEEEWEANIETRRAAAVAAAAVREMSASLDLARAESEVENAMLREAERVFNRRQELVGNGSISTEEHDTAKATAEAQAARVKVVERRIEELQAKLARAEADATAASRHAELRTEERRRLELARVALAEAQLRLDRMVVVAPISGVVMRRLVEPGSVLMTSSDNPEMARVAELYDPENLQVRVDVPLVDAAKVGVGQPAEVVVEILSDQVFHGTVTRVTNLADIQKNTLEVKVAIDNPAAELKPDMLARVRFLSAKNSANEIRTAGGLSVFAPAEALENGTAWVVTQFDGEEGIAAKRSVVTAGVADDEWQEIESGLLPGDLVIVSPNEDLRPEQRVRLQKGEDK